MASIQCGSCRGTHTSVAEVRECHGVMAPPVVAVERVYLGVTFDDKDDAKSVGCRWDPDERAWWIPRTEYDRYPERYKRWEITDVNKRRNAQAVDDGYYDHEGAIYRVVHAVHGSGFPYAQRLHCTEDRFGRPRGSWRKAPGAQFSLRPEELITDERLRALGKLYGFCVKCGLTLTDPESIARGMGPICSGKGME